MRISKSVSRALCASLLAYAGSSANAFTTSPEMECGTYRVQGVLALNSQSQIILKMQDKTSSPYELILVGGSVHFMLARVGQKVAADVYVPREIHGNNNPVVAFQQWALPNLPESEPVAKLRAEVCGLKEKYKSI